MPTSSRLDWVTELKNHHHEDDVVRLFIEAFTAPPRHEDWSDARARRYILEHFRCGGEVVVACGEEGAVGFCLNVPLAAWGGREDFVARGVPGDSYYISNIVVGASERSRGVGRRLLEASLQRAAGAGFRDVSVRCREDAVAIQVLLDRLGFLRVATYNTDGRKRHRSCGEHPDIADLLVGPG